MENPEPGIIRTPTLLRLLDIKDRRTLWKLVRDAGFSPFVSGGKRIGMVRGDYLKMVHQGSEHPPISISILGDK